DRAALEIRPLSLHELFRSEVEPGAERPSLAGQDHRPEAGFAPQPPGGRDEITEHVQGQRVELVGPFESHVGDTIIDRASNMAHADRKRTRLNSSHVKNTYA